MGYDGKERSSLRRMVIALVLVIIFVVVLLVTLYAAGAVFGG